MNDHPLAYEDDEFMESTEARPIRILAEYLDPLRRFKAHNIQDTVVFFGSARVLSRTLAQRNLSRLEKATTAKGRLQGGAEAQPEGARVVALLRGRARAGQAADEVEHVARGAAAPLRRLFGRRSRHHGGGEPRGQGSGRQVGRPEHRACRSSRRRTDTSPKDLVFNFHYFFMRKFWFAYLAKALVIFPGGFGTHRRDVRDPDAGADPEAVEKTAGDPLRQRVLERRVPSRAAGRMGRHQRRGPQSALPGRFADEAFEELQRT